LFDALNRLQVAVFLINWRPLQDPNKSQLYLDHRDLAIIRYLKDLNQVLQETRLEKANNPNLADAYLLAAEAYMGLKQYNLCASEYQQAIKLRPQSATIYVKMAKCYRRAGSLDAAMAMLTKAASEESGLADIYKEQGAIYETKGEVDLAIESYNQYFVLDPNAPDRAQIEQRIMSLQRQ